MFGPFIESTKLIVLFFISEKLYNSSGRDLRRALFSLKQIFQVKGENKSQNTTVLIRFTGELDTCKLTPLLQIGKSTHLSLSPTMQLCA